MNATSYAPGTTGGNREWLEDRLTILEPEETPFVSMVAKDNEAKAVLWETVADSLRAPRTTGSREGDSGTRGGNKAKNRARFGAYLQRFHDSFGATDVQQAISEKGGTAGVSNEYVNDKSKCLREVKRDIEATICSNNECQGGSDDEMKLRGAFKWLAGTGQSPTVPTAFQVPAAQRPTSVTALQETTHINAVLKSLNAQGSKPSQFEFICGNNYTEDFDEFTRTGDAGTTKTRYTVDNSSEAITIGMMVRVFRSSFGTVVQHNSQFVNIDSSGVGNAAAGLMLNMEHWHMSFLEALHAVDDTEDAGGKTGYVKAIGGLFCRMPKGSGFIAGTLA